MRILAVGLLATSIVASAQEVDAQALFDSTTKGSSLSAADLKQLQVFLDGLKQQSAERFKAEEAETRKQLRTQANQENVDALRRSLTLKHGDKLQAFLKKNPNAFKNLKLSPAQEREINRTIEALAEEHKARLDDRAKNRFLEIFEKILLRTGRVHRENEQVTFPSRDLGEIPRLPEGFVQYGPLLDAIGQLKGAGDTCTASHLGGGLVLTAGHCFDLEWHLREQADCGRVSVNWGILADGASSLVSTCTSVLVDEYSPTRDFALLRVAPFPHVGLRPRLTPLPALGQKVAVFGYPTDQTGKQLTLRASPPCPLISATNASRPPDAEMLAYQCDTLGGQSGGPLLDADSLEVIGVHNGGIDYQRSPGDPLRDAFNYATIFRAPVFGQYFPGAPAAANPEPRCADLAQRLERVFQADGGLPPLSLTEDHLQIVSCGTEAQRQVLADALRRQSDGGEPIFVTTRFALSRLQQKPQLSPRVKNRASAACDGGTDCVVAVVVDTRAVDLSTESAPGGDSISNAISVAYNCGLGHATTGHFEYSNYAALAAGFTRDGSKLIANATQDVDDYQWFNASAHAQTPNPRKHGLFAKLPSEARVDFRKWEQCQLKRAKEGCARPEVTLYWLGAALHGVQDLLFHKGITNAEHSYRDHKKHEGRDCATSDGNALAHRVSLGLLNGFLATVPADCAIRLKSASGIGVTGALREETWGHRDRVGPWMSEYFEEGDAFERLVAHGVPPSQYQLAELWWTDASTAESLATELLGTPEGDPCAP